MSGSLGQLLNLLSTFIMFELTLIPHLLIIKSWFVYCTLQHCHEIETVEQESKRAFFYSSVTEGGDKEKLETFVNFCEDAIFEMQHASALMASEEEGATSQARQAAYVLPLDDEDQYILIFFFFRFFFSPFFFFWQTRWLFCYLPTTLIWISYIKVGKDIDVDLIWFVIYWTTDIF